jgi:hypothetical protein
MRRASKGTPLWQPYVEMDASILEERVREQLRATASRYMPAALHACSHAYLHRKQAFRSSRVNIKKKN